MENSRTPNKRHIIYGPKWQLNTNSRDGVSLRWTELYKSSVLVSFFLVVRSGLAYARRFATIIRNTFFTGNGQEDGRNRMKREKGECLQKCHMNV